MAVLDKGVTHVPDRMEQDGVRFDLSAQNSGRFKTCQLFIFGIFRLVFLGGSQQWVTETVERGTADKQAMYLDRTSHLFSTGPQKCQRPDFVLPLTPRPHHTKSLITYLIAKIAFKG